MSISTPPEFSRKPRGGSITSGGDHKANNHIMKKCATGCFFAV